MALIIDPNIPSGDDELKEPLKIDEGFLVHFSDGKISISLKYYKETCECFSKWQKKELKGLTNLIEKLRSRTFEQVRTNTKLCHAHLGEPSKEKFSRPEEISPEIRFYGLRVTDKARVHGFFFDPVFFLVWLDRKHECFPDN